MPWSTGYSRPSRERQFDHFVFKNCPNRCRVNAREPLSELVDRCAVLEILEKRRYRDSSSSEHPCTADFFGVAFYGVARPPISHIAFQVSSVAFIAIISHPPQPNLHLNPIHAVLVAGDFVRDLAVDVNGQRFVGDVIGVCRDGGG